MPKRTEQEKERSNIILDPSMEHFAKEMTPGDQCWLLGSKISEGEGSMILSAPTLAFAEEIKIRFGALLSRSFKKTITYNWREDGAKEGCKYGHFHRIRKLNPHVGYVEPSNCKCYRCSGFKQVVE